MRIFFNLLLVGFVNSLLISASFHYKSGFVEAGIIKFEKQLVTSTSSTHDQQQQQQLGSGFCSLVIAPFGHYTCTEYAVSTSDGFILSLQSIAVSGITRAAMAAKGPLIFLPSTLVGAGDVWFYDLEKNKKQYTASPSSLHDISATTASSSADHGRTREPSSSSTTPHDSPIGWPLPLAAANQGYSVWIVNFRASRWSFGHATLNSSHPDYWDWCTDELARYDFRSVLEFVFAVSDQHPVHLVAFSEGARVAMAAMSLYPETDSIIKSATLVAPIIFLRHLRTPLMRGLYASGFAEFGYTSGIGRFSFSPFSNVFSPSLKDASPVKQQLIATFMGNSCCIDPPSVYSILTGGSSYTSFKDIASLTQGIRSGIFHAYDYGSMEANMARYNGSEVPPLYDVSSLPQSIPMLVVYGGSDGLAHHHDVRTFANTLPKRPRLLYLRNYSHVDFVFSRSLYNDVTLPILKFLSRH